MYKCVLTSVVNKMQCLKAFGNPSYLRSALLATRQGHIATMGTLTQAQTPSIVGHPIPHISLLEALCIGHRRDSESVYCGLQHADSIRMPLVGTHTRAVTIQLTNQHILLCAQHRTHAHRSPGTLARPHAPSAHYRAMGRA